MDTLEVVDDYTVKFTIKETFAPFLTKVAIPTNHWAVRRFGQTKHGKLGLVILCLLLFSAAVPSLIAPYDPLAVEMHNRLQPPSLRHPFGANDFGRDILSRLIYGAFISMISRFAMYFRAFATLDLPPHTIPISKSARRL